MKGLNVAYLLVICLPLFVVAYFIYGRFIGGLLGVDAKRKTPAYALEDGRDFVPANPLVLFSHHFASIAGGGPVIGPAVALIFGYGPAWLMRKRKPFVVALAPAGFMLATTTASLLNLLFTKYIPQGNLTLAVADILLLALSVAFVLLAVSVLRKVGNHAVREARSQVF
jgi:carbon starvation protein CstA